MTKAELEKEADKYADYYATPDLDCSFRAYMFEASKEGYLAGAEPREKRIAKLEQQLSAMEKGTCDVCKVKDVEFYESRIAELEESLLDVAEKSVKRIAELEAQIEKMKNWCNCKNYQQCLIELAEQGKGMKPSECCVNCKKWEIKENDKSN